MSATPLARLTPEQYLDIERAAEFRSEFYDGEMYAMPGGLLPHALIGAALITALTVALQGGTCRAAGSDLRVGIAQKGAFFYPDVSVHCGEPQLADDYKDALLNPALIIEVLSPSTEAFDRGKKFASYRRIESLREYVLVSQTEPSVESYLRGPGGMEAQWTLTEFTGMDAICRLRSIACAISLADIYRGVELAPG